MKLDSVPSDDEQVYTPLSLLLTVVKFRTTASPGAATPTDGPLFHSTVVLMALSFKHTHWTTSGWPSVTSSGSGMPVMFGKEIKGHASAWGNPPLSQTNTFRQPSHHLPSELDEDWASLVATTASSSSKSSRILLPFELPTSTGLILDLHEHVRKWLHVGRGSPMRNSKFCTAHLYAPKSLFIIYLGVHGTECTGFAYKPPPYTYRCYCK